MTMISRRGFFRAIAGLVVRKPVASRGIQFHPMSLSSVDGSPWVQTWVAGKVVTADDFNQITRSLETIFLKHEQVLKAAWLGDE